MRSMRTPWQERRKPPIHSGRRTGRYLGFLAAGKIKTIEATGGPVQILADGPVRSGATWSRDGRILFIPRLGALGTAPAGGGSVSPIAVAGFWPYFLPD